MNNILNTKYNVSKTVLGSVVFLSIVLVPLGLKINRDTNLFSILNIYASAKEQNNAHADKNQEHDEGVHGGQEVHHAPPFKYYIHWAVLLFALGKVLLYFKKKFKTKEHEAEHHEEHSGHEDGEEEGGHHGIHVVQEAKGMAALLCCLVIFLFFVEYAPSLANYHESVPAALFKFAVKMTLGIGLTTFGILGMDEH